MVRGITADVIEGVSLIKASTSGVNATNLIVKENESRAKASELSAKSCRT